MTLICFQRAGRYPTNTVISLWVAMMICKCHVKRVTGAAPEDHRMHSLPEHLFQVTWHGDNSCAQPQLSASQTWHTTPRSSEWLLKASVANPGQVLLPSFCLVHSSQNEYPPPASSPVRIMWYSKLLLQDAAGKLDTPVSSLYNEFSVRNTASAASAEVKRLCLRTE